GRRTEQPLVPERLLFAEVHRGEEGVRRVAQLGDGHDRDQLRRGVQGVVPALPPEPASPAWQGVWRREPVEGQRTQLAGIGTERRNAVRAGNLRGGGREEEHWGDGMPRLARLEELPCPIPLR